MKMKTADVAYRDIWRGLFYAPATGAYTFFISGDDQSEFFIDTSTPFSSSTASYTPTQICNVPSHTDFQKFHWYTEQTSVPQTLTSGNYYYVEIKHREGGGGDHLTVGVEVPNTENFWPVNYIYAT